MQNFYTNSEVDTLILESYVLLFHSASINIGIHSYSYNRSTTNANTNDVISAFFCAILSAEAFDPEFGDRCTHTKFKQKESEILKSNHTYVHWRFEFNTRGWYSHHFNIGSLLVIQTLRQLQNDNKINNSKKYIF